ncbi:MAG: hypothetical protein ACFFAN_11550 [Promethearchaeota archaeon]
MKLDNLAYLLTRNRLKPSYAIPISICLQTYLLTKNRLKKSHSMMKDMSLAAYC